MEKTEEQKARQGRPLIFGEVLYDNFPDGSSVLGGAPFNVAWHLKGLGLEPLFISRIGNDDNGRRVEQAMRAWGMDLAGLQHDPQHPTGLVSIELNQGQPSFSILADRAYDFIAAAPALVAIQNSTPALLYFGSLINRSETSRETLAAIRRLPLAAYVDINLRQPWWNAQVIDLALTNARWAKLNDDEIRLVSGAEDLINGARQLLRRYALEWIIVTRGADGACIVTAAEVIDCAPVRVENIVDTVGAGDSFSAVTLYGIMHGWPLHDILRRAVAFAAEICKVRGATVNDPAFYQNIIQEWAGE